MHMQKVPRVGGPVNGSAIYLPDYLTKELCSRDPGSKDWCHYVLEEGPVYRYTGLCADLACTVPDAITECAPPQRRDGEQL